MLHKYTELNREEKFKLFMILIILLGLMFGIVQTITKKLDFKPKNDFSAVELKQFKKLKLSNYFTKKDENINANFKNFLVTLPDGEEVFFEQFDYDQTIHYGNCNSDNSVCYIYPQYRLNPGNKACIRAKLSDDWGTTGFTILEKDDSCIEKVNLDHAARPCGPA